MQNAPRFCQRFEKPRYLLARAFKPEPVDWLFASDSAPLHSWCAMAARASNGTDNPRPRAEGAVENCVAEAAYHVTEAKRLFDELLSARTEQVDAGCMRNVLTVPLPHVCLCAFLRCRASLSCKSLAQQVRVFCCFNHQVW
jgi:hypothetical protein